MKTDLSYFHGKIKVLHDNARAEYNYLFSLQHAAGKSSALPCWQDAICFFIFCYQQPIGQVVKKYPPDVNDDSIYYPRISRLRTPVSAFYYP